MIQYTFRSICLTLGLFIAALPAQAFEFNPYAGVGLGEVIVDAGLGGKTAFAGYGIVGADLHENYGFEVRFGTTGKTGSVVTVPAGLSGGEVQVPTTAPTTAKISVDWFVSYLLKLQYPVSDLFKVYGVVGGTTLKSKFAFTSPVNGATALHATNTTLSYGGGFEYGLGNQWTVGVDATVYANKATTTTGANFSGLDVWGINATARYGF
ncbi:MAG TPA: outer membrane beta-barrel protein [Mariprofundaceae bacterium]|nr:outer membrane beta-barrel protein [Mariprofundaceae bacterium]